MTTKRITWGLMAGRRLAAARGIDINEGEEFARQIAPKIIAIAHAIVDREQRRGPREISLYMLRNITGRHAKTLADLIVEAPVEAVASTLLLCAVEGPRLAASNSLPARTPPAYLRVTVFHDDGRRTAWQRVAMPAEDNDHERNGGHG